MGKSGKAAAVRGPLMEGGGILREGQGGVKKISPGLAGSRRGAKIFFLSPSLSDALRAHGEKRPQKR